MTSTTKPHVTFIPIPEQRFVFPGEITWKQFKTLESLFEGRRSVRLSYLDGCVEIMTISPQHETIKCLIAALVITFFVEKDISFTPTGSATIQSKQKSSSKEPDLSYRFGEDRKERTFPDLVIEVIITSGNLKKLAYYQRFGVSEVWFWKNNKFTVYHLRGEDYEKVTRSELLPELDLTLLAQCLQMPEEKEAMKFFRNTIRG